MRRKVIVASCYPERQLIDSSRAEVLTTDRLEQKDLTAGQIDEEIIERYWRYFMREKRVRSKDVCALQELWVFHRLVAARGNQGACSEGRCDL
jgi:hypothetical protein